MVKIKLFISYSHKDVDYKNTLLNHLSGLKNKGLIDQWNDTEILPGAEWDREIKQQLRTSNIVLFLMSSDFMASDYINNIEIKNAFERYHENEIIILPIILRPFDFENSGFNQFKTLPKDGRAITTWENQDLAFLDVVKGLEMVIKNYKKMMDSKKKKFKEQEQPINYREDSHDIKMNFENLLKKLYSYKIFDSSDWYKVNFSLGVLQKMKLISTEEVDFIKNKLLEYNSLPRKPGESKIIVSFLEKSKLTDKITSLISILG